jgi:hypothetical protein
MPVPPPIQILTRRTGKVQQWQLLFPGSMHTWPQFITKVKWNKKGRIAMRCQLNFTGQAGNALAFKR